LPCQIPGGSVQYILSKALTQTDFELCGCPHVSAPDRIRFNIGIPVDNLGANLVSQPGGRTFLWEIGMELSPSRRSAPNRENGRPDVSAQLRRRFGESLRGHDCFVTPKNSAGHDQLWALGTWPRCRRSQRATGSRPIRSFGFRPQPLLKEREDRRSDLGNVRLKGDVPCVEKGTLWASGISRR